MKKTQKQQERQVSFYCSQEFLDTIHAEKVRRGMTIQEMVIEALLDFFARPSDKEVEANRRKEEEVAKQLEETGHVRWDELPPRFEMNRWMDLCMKYYQRMPKAKRDLLKEFIILDLKHYASSRLKRPKDE
jgi:hypothetical protein